MGGIKDVSFKMSLTLSLKCFKLYENVYFGIAFISRLSTSLLYFFLINKRGENQWMV
ncbi:hypothetical protein BavelB3_10480 [Bacillus velezensis]